MPTKRETVYERRQKNGGYLTGPNHPITRYAREEEKRKEAAKRAMEEADKPEDKVALHWDGVNSV